mmetsp:Transcript_89706/g.249184  ORF Transcript_89706/g.249184 Transcript_89706/m.249184 type:complete len:259 (-) Transcript_89706:1646-2422(-)
MRAHFSVTSAALKQSLTTMAISANTISCFEYSDRFPCADKSTTTRSTRTNVVVSSTRKPLSTARQTWRITACSTFQACTPSEKSPVSCAANASTIKTSPLATWSTQYASAVKRPLQNAKTPTSRVWRLAPSAAMLPSCFATAAARAATATAQRITTETLCWSDTEDHFAWMRSRCAKRKSSASALPSSPFWARCRRDIRPSMPPNAATQSCKGKSAASAVSSPPACSRTCATSCCTQSPKAASARTSSARRYSAEAAQ